MQHAAGAQAEVEGSDLVAGVEDGQDAGEPGLPRRVHVPEQLAAAGVREDVRDAGRGVLLPLPRDRLREQIRVVAIGDEAQRSNLARELAGLAQRPPDVGGRPPPAWVEAFRQVEVGARALAPDVRCKGRDPGGEVIERPCREAARAHELARVDRGGGVEYGAVVVGERPADGPPVPAAAHFEREEPGHRAGVLDNGDADVAHTRDGERELGPEERAAVDRARALERGPALDLGRHQRARGHDPHGHAASPPRRSARSATARKNATSSPVGTASRQRNPVVER